MSQIPILVALAKFLYFIDVVGEKNVLIYLYFGQICVLRHNVAKKVGGPLLHFCIAQVQLF